MATVDAALAQFKVILAAANPASPADALVACYIYPADYASIDLSSLPVIIVGQQVNTNRLWRRKAIGLGLHRWTAEIMLLLEHGPITNDEVLAQAEAKQNPWPKEIADLLLVDQQLNGTANWIGEGPAADSDLFRYRLGHIQFWQKVFWGGRFLVDVVQVHSQPMKPG